MSDPFDAYRRALRRQVKASLFVMAATYAALGLDPLSRATVAAALVVEGM